MLPTSKSIISTVTKFDQGPSTTKENSRKKEKDLGLTGIEGHVPFYKLDPDSRVVSRSVKVTRPRNLLVDASSAV